jgi:hypothetical protein
MFKRKIIYTILFVVILLLLQIYLSKEKFNSNFNVNKDTLSEEQDFISTDENRNYISYTNQKNRVFNNNYNAVWLKPRVGYNNKRVNDLPSGVNDYKEEVTSYSYYINIDTFQKLLNDFNKENTLNYFEFTSKIQNFGKLITITHKLGNEKIWENKYSYDPNRNIPIDFIESKYQDVNRIVKYVLKNINLLLKNNYEKIQKKRMHSEKLFLKSKFKFYPFFILKYKIVKYYEPIKKVLSKDKHRIFEIRMCILRQNDINVLELYIIGYIEHNKNNPILQNILFIGNGPVSNYLIRSGITEPNYYDIHHPDVKNNVTFENAEEILKEREQYDKNTNEFSLKYQYRCFDVNNEDLIINTNNKLDCENEIDWYGRIKDYGVWDKPCISDDECIYFKENKNYTNNYGKCLPSGHCQMPLNTKKIGYHLEKSGSKSICYNCNSEEWKPFTELDDCCEEQEKDILNKDNRKEKDRKYPFLNSPDYAFHNDLNTRINAEIQKKYEHHKYYIKYEDLFDKNKFTYYYK